MSYFVGCSVKEVPEAAVEEICSQIGSDVPHLILFFSGSVSFGKYTSLLQQRFPHSNVVGAVSDISFCPGHTQDKELTLAAFSDGTASSCCVIEEIKRYPKKYLPRLQRMATTLPAENSVCFLLTTGGKSCEELVLDTVDIALKPLSIPVFGGSTAPASPKEKNFISCNGIIYDEATVAILLHDCCGKISLHSQNIYKATKTVFTVTDAYVPERIVFSLNGEPATEILTKTLKVPKENLLNCLWNHPLGRLVNDDIRITEAKEIVDGTALTFYANVYNQTVMMLMECGDFKTYFGTTLEQIRREMKKTSFSFVVTCASQAVFFKQQRWFETFRDEIGKSLGLFIGFCPYGEQLNNNHMNQTTVIVSFE